MKLVMITLVLFIFIKGPEYYNHFIELQNKETKSSITTFYGNDPLEKIGIKFPNVVRAQIALETRWLTSKIYRKNNNLFGMKASSRHWDRGNQFSHALYDNRTHSLLDYRDWQAQMFAAHKRKGGKDITTEEEYIYFLQHLPGGGAYAEDPLYPSKLRYIMNL